VTSEEKNLLFLLCSKIKNSHSL